jgi:hypothetical protein
MLILGFMEVLTIYGLVVALGLLFVNLLFNPKSQLPLSRLVQIHWIQN